MTPSNIYRNFYYQEFIYLVKTNNFLVICVVCVTTALLVSWESIQITHSWYYLYPYNDTDILYHYLLKKTKWISN